MGTEDSKGCMTNCIFIETSLHHCVPAGHLVGSVGATERAVAFPRNAWGFGLPAPSVPPGRLFPSLSVFATHQAFRWNAMAKHFVPFVMHP